MPDINSARLTRLGKLKAAIDELINDYVMAETDGLARRANVETPSGQKAVAALGYREAELSTRFDPVGTALDNAVTAEALDALNKEVPA